MTFFNQKENILELKLTNYGEDLLSMGKFKPVFYSFSDEGVNYIFSSSGDGQNDIDGRIKLDTPYLRVQKNRFSNLNDEKTKSINIVGVDFETEIAKRESLGKCDTIGSGSSRIKIFVLDNEIESANNFYTSSNNTRPDLPIPQINITLDYKTAVDDAFEPTTNIEPDPDLSTEDVYADGGVVIVESEFLTLAIQEEGVPSSFADFEVEVFEIMSEQSFLGDDQLRKLNFVKQLEDTFVSDDNIYLNKRQRDRNRNLIDKYPPTTGDVEFYFDLFTDDYNEIPDSFICEVASQYKATNPDFALDAVIGITCPDTDPVTVIQDDPYGNGLPSSDDCN